MKLKILYIDDEQDLCDIFTELNSSDEVEIKTFVDPRAALAHSAQEKPDLVFMDYRLPGTTGDKVAAALNVAAPIYLISGDLNVKSSFEFIRILGKPVDHAEINKIIRSWIEKKKL